MCSACRLIVLYICVKFGIRVMEWTRMMEALMNGWTDTQNFGWYTIIPSPLFVAGQKKETVNHKIHPENFHPWNS